MNIANGRAKIQDPHPAVSIFNFHYCVPPDVIAWNDHIQGVIGENETGFRGKEDVLYRTEGCCPLVIIAASLPDRSVRS